MGQAKTCKAVEGDGSLPVGVDTDMVSRLMSMIKAGKWRKIH